jgi:hypothetical protein
MVLLTDDGKILVKFLYKRYIRCHIDTINSPDDAHMAARNM